MVSQGSFCDSDGLPRFMQDGLEVDSLVELCARIEVEDFPILVGMSEGLKTKPSSSEGIDIACD